MRQENLHFDMKPSFLKQRRKKKQVVCADFKLHPSKCMPGFSAHMLKNPARDQRGHKNSMPETLGVIFDTFYDIIAVLKL